MATLKNLENLVSSLSKNSLLQKSNNAAPCFKKNDFVLDVASLPEKIRTIVESNQMIIIGKIGEVTREKSFIEENRKFVSFYNKEYVNKVKLSSVEAILSFKEKEMEFINFMN